MSQSHGTSLWQEPAQSGATPAVAPAYFVADGSDVELSLTGPEGFAFFLVGSDYVLINLTPVLGVYYDTGGNAQSIDPLTTPRLNAVSVRGDIQPF